MCTLIVDAKPSRVRYLNGSAKTEIIQTYPRLPICTTLGNNNHLARVFASPTRLFVDILPSSLTV